MSRKIKKLLLLTGEESGILYARQITEAVRAHFPSVEVRGYGDWGFETGDLAVMGFGAVLRKIFYFLRVKRTMERAIDEWRPDVVCTIDYPGMNLKLASYAKKRGAYTVHVVCPQVWAWKAGRIPKIEAALDKLCCFFPFEPKLFKPGFAEFVGHPLAGEFKHITSGAEDKGVDAAKKIIALLPGSRIGEIEHNLPVMLDAARIVLKESRENVRFVIPAANKGAEGAIRKLLSSRNTDDLDLEMIFGGARELLQRAYCAVVASGTATLEAALSRCPTVLVYKVSALLAWFARRVIKGIKHVGLINIIAEKSGMFAPMPELLQEAYTPEAVAAMLIDWLNSKDRRTEAIEKLEATLEKLGDGGSAIERIANMLVR